MFEYKVKLIKVIDGDTVDLEVDLGFGMKFQERFRLYGIDAPETRTRNKIEKAKGMETKAWLRQLLKNNPDSLIIKTHKDMKGKFGRYLCEIYYSKKKININQLMVRTGLAEYVKY